MSLFGFSSFYQDKFHNKSKRLVEGYLVSFFFFFPPVDIVYNL